MNSLRQLFLYIIFIISSIGPAFSQSCNVWETQKDVTSIINDHQYVWLATTGGLIKLDTTTNQKTHYNKYNSGLLVNNIRLMKEDVDGNLWMLANNSVVIFYDKIHFTTYDLHDIFPEVSFDGSLRELHISSTDEIWISSSKFLFHFKPSTGQWEKIVVAASGYTIHFLVSIIITDGVPYILAYANSVNETGALLLSYNNPGFSPLVLVPNSDAINFTSNMVRDLSGDFLLCKNNGDVLKINQTNFGISVVPIPLHAKNCPNVIVSFLKFHNDTLILGSEGITGLVFWDTGSNIWTSINSYNSSLQACEINDCFLSGLHIYMATNNHMVKINRSTLGVSTLILNSGTFNQAGSFTGVSIADNKLWVGEANANTMQSIDLTTSVSDIFEVSEPTCNPVNVIKDHNSRYWFSGAYGIFYKDNNTGWIRYTYNDLGTLRFSNEIAVDNNNMIWVATGDGILKIDPLLNSVVRIENSAYPEQNSNNIYALFFDGTFIWFTTNLGGLYRLTTAGVLTKYQQDEHYYDIGVISHFEYYNGELYFMDFKAVRKINPSSGTISRIFEMSDYINQTRRAPVAFSYYSKNQFCVNQVSGDIWIVDKKNAGLYQFVPSTGIFHRYYYANSCFSDAQLVTSDASGNIYACGNSSVVKVSAYSNIVTSSLNAVESKQASATVYPNPMAEQSDLQISISAESAVESVSLYTLLGAAQAVELSFMSVDDKVVISSKTAVISPGTYVIRLTFDDGTYQAIPFVKL